MNSIALWRASLCFKSDLSTLMEKYSGGGLY